MHHTGRRVFPEAEAFMRKGYLMVGGALDGEEEEWRKARGYGQVPDAQKISTYNRVVNHEPGLGVKDVDPLVKEQGIRASAKAVGGARG